MPEGLTPKHYAEYARAVAQHHGVPYGALLDAILVWAIHGNPSLPHQLAARIRARLITRPIRST